jgi:hypothetical protein
MDVCLHLYGLRRGRSSSTIPTIQTIRRMGRRPRMLGEESCGGLDGIPGKDAQAEKNAAIPAKMTTIPASMSMTMVSRHADATRGIPGPSHGAALAVRWPQ